ncbi:hypothetical protein [Nocardiopsis tropica]|uniref:Uncharacterized protein n=1 Tax=Nocardiopsis tropica TaxID=109330 RepID=A0ABV1ZUZ1_9ACTN
MVADDNVCGDVQTQPRGVLGEDPKAAPAGSGEPGVNLTPSVSGPDSRMDVHSGDVVMREVVHELFEQTGVTPQKRAPSPRTRQEYEPLTISHSDGLPVAFPFGTRHQSPVEARVTHEMGHLKRLRNHIGEDGTMILVGNTDRRRNDPAVSDKVGINSIVHRRTHQWRPVAGRSLDDLGETDPVRYDEGRCPHLFKVAVVTVVRCDSQVELEALHLIGCQNEAVEVPGVGLSTPLETRAPAYSENHLDTPVLLEHSEKIIDPVCRLPVFEKHEKSSLDFESNWGDRPDRISPPTLKSISHCFPLPALRSSWKQQ